MRIEECDERVNDEKDETTTTKTSLFEIEYTMPIRYVTITLAIKENGLGSNAMRVYAFVNELHLRIHCGA